jgi:hypothetical protein
MCRWEGNIKLQPNDTRCEGVNAIKLVPHTDKRKSRVCLTIYNIIKKKMEKKKGKYLTHLKMAI